MSSSIYMITDRFIVIKIIDNYKYIKYYVFDTSTKKRIFIDSSDLQDLQTNRNYIIDCLDKIHEAGDQKWQKLELYKNRFGFIKTIYDENVRSSVIRFSDDIDLSKDLFIKLLERISEDRSDEYLYISTKQDLCVVIRGDYFILLNLSDSKDVFIRLPKSVFDGLLFKKNEIIENLNNIEMFVDKRAKFLNTVKNIESAGIAHRIPETHIDVCAEKEIFWNDGNYCISSDFKYSIMSSVLCFSDKSKMRTDKDSKGIHMEKNFLDTFVNNIQNILRKIV